VVVEALAEGEVVEAEGDGKNNLKLKTNNSKLMYIKNPA
jgi:hypothetical protein